MGSSDSRYMRTVSCRVATGFPNPIFYTCNSIVYFLTKTFTLIATSIDMQRRALLTGITSVPVVLSGCMDVLNESQSLSSYDCPPFDIDDDVDGDIRVICSNSVDEDRPAYAELSQETAGSATEIEIVVRNNTDRSVEYGVWDLWESKNDRWEKKPVEDPSIARATIQKGESVNEPLTYIIERFGVSPSDTGTFAAETVLTVHALSYDIRSIVLWRIN